VHVIGKDITKFHAIIWPAMLLSADLAPPRKLAVHGFVYIGGRKISKTETASDPQRAIMKDPVALADRFGADTVRYFLLREVAFGQDGEISYEKLTTRHNSDLGDILGNLLNRIVSMTERYQGGVFTTRGVPLPQDATLRDTVGDLADRVGPLMNRFDFHTALAEIWKAATATNGHIEATAPWKLAKAQKSDEVAGVLYQSAEALRIVAILLSPFVPSTSRRILEQLGIPDCPLQLEKAREWDYIRVGTRIQKGPVLFQKIDASAEQF
jgi:methionyl-tRNA synthetase